MQRYVYFPIEYKRNFFSSNKNHIQGHLSFFFFFFFFLQAYTGNGNVTYNCICPALTKRPFLVSSFLPERFSFLVSSFELLCFSPSLSVSRNGTSLQRRERSERESGQQDFFFFVLRPFQRARSRRNGRGPYFVTR